MPSSKRPGVGKKLQYSIMIPMVLAILVCSLITILLLYADYEKWVDETEDHITQSEVSHLSRVSAARGKKFSTLLNDVRDT